MSTTTPQRHRVYRIDGDKKPINVELPKTMYVELVDLSQRRGWSLAEATRQAIALFLERNKDIDNVLLSSINGHSE